MHENICISNSVLHNKRITRDPSQAALLLIYNLITNHFDRRAATHSHSHTYVITLKLGIYKGVKSILQ